MQKELQTLGNCQGLPCYRFCFKVHPVSRFLVSKHRSFSNALKIYFPCLEEVKMDFVETSQITLIYFRITSLFMSLMKARGL